MKDKPEAPDWAIIYDDYSVFTSDDGSFEDAPAWGVQAIVFRSVETGWSIATTGAYFIRLPDGDFLPIGDDALMDYAANVWKKVKVGRMISQKEWGKISGLALELMGDVKKTARFKWEKVLAAADEAARERAENGNS